MRKIENQDGTFVYELTPTDIINMFVAHIEHGTGKVFHGGSYNAVVRTQKTYGPNDVGVTVTVKPTKD